MQIRQLEYFVSLCETLNFTRTAEEFYVSQTAVTQQIHALKEELGALLFHRTRRMVEMTPAGEQLYDDAKLILRQLRDAEMRVRQVKNVVSGSLKIGILTGYAQYGMARALHAFHAALPDVTLSFLTGSSPELYRALELGTIDLAVVHSYPQRSGEFLCAASRRFPIVAVCAPDDPLAKKSVVCAADLTGRPSCLLHSQRDNSGESAAIRSFYRKIGIVPEAAYESDDIAAVMLAAAAGLGYALMPGYFTDALQGSEALTVRPLAGQEQAIEVALLYRPDSPNPLIPRFLEIYQ